MTISTPLLENRGFSFRPHLVAVPRLGGKKSSIVAYHGLSK